MSDKRFEPLEFNLPQNDLSREEESNRKNEQAEIEAAYPGLKQKTLYFIEAMAACCTVIDSACIASISRSTAYEWLKNPEVGRAIARRRYENHAEFRSAAQRVMEKGFRTIEDILDSSSRPATKLAALRTLGIARLAQIAITEPLHLSPEEDDKER